MENASKALIIAGAILISILLIAVGVMVMNSINDPIDQAADSAKGQAVEMFNSKFTGYAGDQKSAAVKALMTAIQSSNGSNAERTITAKTSGNWVSNANFDTNATTNNIGKIQAAVNSQRKYNVEFEYGTGTSAGYITGVIVTEKQ